MKFILRLKNAYFAKRKAYYLKKYQKYSSLLKMQRTFYFLIKDKDSYYERETYLSELCQKYKNKSLMFSQKIKPIIPY